MSRNWLLRLDKRCPDEPIKILPGDQELLEVTIRAMSNDVSTTLSIDDASKQTEEGFGESPPVLIVGASDGNYIVSVQLVYGDFFDLIGNPSATGTLDFTIGGQTAPYPRKYLVSIEQALAAALEFFDTGTIDVTNGKWDDQHTPNSAWVQEGLVGL